MHRAHCVWLEFTSGHLAVAHRSFNFVTVLREQAIPGQMGGRHTSLQSSMTGEAGMQQFQGLPCAELCQAHVQEAGCFLETLLSEQRLYLPMHIWCVRYSQTSHSPGSRSRVLKQNENLDKSTKASHFTLQISGTNSRCIQVFENQKERKRQKDSHIPKFLSCCRSA